MRLEGKYYVLSCHFLPRQDKLVPYMVTCGEIELTSNGGDGSIEPPPRIGMIYDI